MIQNQTLSGNPEEKKIVLDLACGQLKTPGSIGVDIVDCEGVDIVHNLESYPWPFEDNYADEVHINHFVEHLSDIMKFMNELHRIMKPGAKCFIVAPYYSSVRSWQDPTHKIAISEATFLYYNKSWRDINKLDHYPITADFDFSCGYNFYPDWHYKNEEARQFALKHYWNVAADINATLTKR